MVIWEFDDALTSRISELLDRVVEAASRLVNYYEATVLLPSTLRPYRTESGPVELCCGFGGDPPRKTSEVAAGSVIPVERGYGVRAYREHIMMPQVGAGFSH